MGCMSVVQAARLHILRPIVQASRPHHGLGELMTVSKQIITRRCLPHWYVPGASHFVTYRLNGSLSTAALRQLRTKKEALTAASPKEQSRVLAHKQLFALYDSLLDEQNGLAWLADPRIASMIRENLYHHHGSKYYLQAY